MSSRQQWGTRGVTSNPMPEVSILANVAYALGVLQLDIVHRATIRAMLPEKGIQRPKTASGRLARSEAGHSQGYNRTSKLFSDALFKLERDGLIDRGEKLVRVVKRQALLDRALEIWEENAANGENDSEPSLRLANAVAALNREIADSRIELEGTKLLDLRRAELARMHVLLAAAPVPGNSHSGRGTVRHFPKGQVI